MKTLLSKPWIWSFVAALSVWLATIGVTGGASTVGLSQAALTFAAFSVLVGIGQMFVITLGPGNIETFDGDVVRVHINRVISRGRPGSRGTA